MESLCILGWLSASDRYSVGSFECRFFRCSVGAGVMEIGEKKFDCIIVDKYLI